MTTTDVTATPIAGETKTLRLAAAINLTLDDLLAADDRVFLLGEDIVDPGGGPMGVTKGLSTKYGTKRVREAPISEQAIVGAATGAAIGGLRPIAEIMIMDFLAVCLDQLTNHAAKARYMTGGRTSCPLVIRCTATGGVQFGAQHSQTLEAWLAHTPGLKVAIPSNPADARGLLTACVEDDDPCVFVEMAQLYALKGEVPLGHHVVPLGHAAVPRAGTDVTIITYGKQVHDALTAAAELDGEISVEVIDLRSLVPLDEATVLASVARTKRAVVVHQAVERCGFGAEIVALLQHELWGTLEAPVERVAGANTPIAFATELEQLQLPSPARIAAACRLACR